MSTRRVSIGRALLLCVGVALAAPPASADVTPDKGDECDISYWKAYHNDECYDCIGTTTDAVTCEELLKPHGFKNICIDHRMPRWMELWCRPAGSAKELPDDVMGRLNSDRRRTGCGCAVVGEPAGIGLAFMMALSGAAALLARRRGRGAR